MLYEQVLRVSESQVARMMTDTRVKLI